MTDVVAIARLMGVMMLAWTAVATAEVHIEAGYVRGMPPGQPTTAAYMRLENTGEKDVVIDAGSSDVAERVEFHGHVHSDGKMGMRQLPGITVPAGGEVELSPGGYHIMLIGLTRMLREGETIELRLFSDNRPVVDAELPVRSVLNEHHH